MEVHRFYFIGFISTDNGIYMKVNSFYFIVTSHNASQ